MKQFFEWIGRWLMPANQKQEKRWFGGLGKDDKKFLTDLKAEVASQAVGVEKLAGAVDQLAKNVGKGKPIEIHLEPELMQLLRELVAKLGSSEAKTVALLETNFRPIIDGLKQLGTP